MSYLKIHQGTGKLTGESLCKSCTHATRITDSRGEHIRCNVNGGFAMYYPHGAVTECNAYYNANLPSLGMLSEIAWELKTEGSGGRVGFKPPQVK